ncbi:MAG: formylglycine-generating enzyme family protein [Phycisphaerae bacterium]
MDRRYRWGMLIATAALGWYGSGCTPVSTVNGSDGSERGLDGGADASNQANPPAADGEGAASTGCEGIPCDGGARCVDGVCPDGVAAPALVEDRLTLDLGGGVTMELVRIQPGAFTMGSDTGKTNEMPVHSVTIDRDYYLGKFEVTQAQWEAVMGNNPSGFSGANLPVEQVSWDAAVAFCEALSVRTGADVRLPSEAEWEYAARAGSTTDYSFGMALGMLGDFAWFRDTSAGQPHDVGLKTPNAWGLYDMHGNVWEWCADLWHDSYAGAPGDGGAWTTGEDLDGRVARGGSWRNFGSFLRTAYRSRFWSGSELNYVGFRVAAGT